MTGIAVARVVALLLAAAGLLMAPTRALGNLPDRTFLRTRYSTQMTRLDDGTNTFTTLASGQPGGGCHVCHGASTAFPDLTQYGARYREGNPAPRDVSRIVTIENEDSDSDGWTNRAELLGRFFPGNAADEPTAGIDVIPATAARSNRPGGVVTYAVQITNTGQATDTFAVTVTNAAGTGPPAWPTSASTTTIAGIDTFTAVPLQVTITIPGSAQEGDSDIARITVTSQGNPAIQASATLTTTAGGSVSGAFLVKDIVPGAVGSQPFEPVPVGGTLFFFAGDPASRALWRSDGTAAGTLLVKNPGPTCCFFPTSLGGALYFVVAPDELWRSDGTAEGTVMLKKLSAVYPPSVQIRTLFDAGGTLYFTLWYDVTAGVTAVAIWKSDGTTAGTVAVADVGNFALPLIPPDPTFARVGTRVFFAGGGVVQPFALWNTDGAPAGTVPLREFADYPRAFADLGGTLLFAGDDGARGSELWRSDGTAAGTVLVKDIEPGSPTSFPSFLTPMGGHVFFSAFDTAHGRELWRTDGTAAGTVLVRDIDPAGGSDPQGMVAFNGQLFFAARTSLGTGNELWKSDGTEAGTVLVKDIRPCTGVCAVPPDGNPVALTAVNGLLFFSADDGVTGIELWRTDGTTAGTVRVADIARGAAGSVPFNLVNVRGILFFAADDGIRGPELWKVPRRLADFDGDGKADLGVFRESTGEWLIFGSATGFAGPIPFGGPGLGDTPLLADYDGDGKADLAVFRRSTGQWFIFGSSAGFPGPILFGAPGLGDLPVPADYDNDGKADLAVFRQSTGQWFVFGSSTGFPGPVLFGATGLGDIPVPADYDGDGKADLAVFRQSTGEWFIFGSESGFPGPILFGAPGLGDIPVPGDYDGDTRADLAVFRRSTAEWFVFGSSNGFPGPAVLGAPGLGDIPVATDFDGDGMADLAVFRQSTGEWFVFGSSTGFGGPVPLGAPGLGDVPLYRPTALR